MMTISSLNRKLLRDIFAMKGQAFAIAMVVAAGVAMYVMYLSNFDSLRETQRAYYERQQFADVFASLKRAPLRVASDIAAIPGVSALETRVVANVTLDLEQLDEPATGRLVSIPADRRPAVNDLFLRRGRWIEQGRADEVLASEGFVTAHGLVPATPCRRIINGRLRRLVIVGVALSPEYVYSIRPGELVPDDRRFGVFWMDREALALRSTWRVDSTMSRSGSRPARLVEEAIAQLDLILEPYGGLGAIPRALQLSHWTLENELAQLQSFGLLLPLIFLMVAAFILNVALTRALALQRAQIAALKALGYDNVAIGWHYMKWALLIGAFGVAIGIAAGGWLGSAIGALYNQYFRFPVLLFRIPLDVVLGAATLTWSLPPPGRSRRCGGPCACRRPKRCVPRRRPGIDERSSKHRSSRAGSASPAAWCCETSHGIRCVRRPRFLASASPSRSSWSAWSLRCHGAADRHAVLGCGAAGRHGEFRGAALGGCTIRARTPAGRRRRRAAARRWPPASEPVIGSAIWRSPVYSEPPASPGRRSRRPR